MKTFKDIRIIKEEREDARILSCLDKISEMLDDCQDEADRIENYSGALPKGQAKKDFQTQVKALTEAILAAQDECEGTSESLEDNYDDLFGESKELEEAEKPLSMRFADSSAAEAYFDKLEAMLKDKKAFEWISSTDENFNTNALKEWNNIWLSFKKLRTILLKAGE